MAAKIPHFLYPVTALEWTKSTSSNFMRQLQAIDFT